MFDLPVIQSSYVITVLILLMILQPSFLQISPLLRYMTKREKIWVAIGFVAIFLMEYYAMMEVYLHGWLMPDYTVYIHVIPIAWIPYFLLCLYWYKGHFFWNVFVVSDAMILVSITHSITYFIMTRVTTYDMYKVYYPYHYILTLLVTMCFFPFLVKFLRNLFAIGRLDASSLMWREVVPVPVMMAFQCMAINLAETNPNHDYVFYSRLTLLVTLLFFGRAIKETLEQTEIIWTMQAEHDELQTQMMSIDDYNRLATKANQRLQKFMCNRRHYLEQIQQLLEQNETKAAMQMIAEMGVSMNRTKLPRFCSNALCNASVSTYVTRAQHNNIPITVSLDLPEEISMDAELSVILSNLLENAIHASLKQLPSKRKISLIAVRQGDSDWVNLLIRNQFDGDVLFDHDGYPRSIREGHGVGTRSMRKFVGDNGGDVLFEYEQGWFSVYLRFNCRT